MSSVVIDASAIIAVITNEPNKDRLIYLTKNADLIAPASIHWEIGNAFSAMFKRDRIILADAIKAVEIYRTIPIRLVNVELDETLKIADRLNIYAYDAYLIRCAIKYNAPLLTLDTRLKNTAKSINLQIKE